MKIISKLKVLDSILLTISPAYYSCNNHQFIQTLHICGMKKTNPDRDKIFIDIFIKSTIKIPLGIVYNAYKKLIVKVILMIFSAV
jgi:hypothetical protein